MAGSPSYGRGRHDTLVEVAGALSKFVKSQQRSNRVLLGLAIAGPIAVAFSSVLVDICTSLDLTGTTRTPLSDGR